MDTLSVDALVVETRHLLLRNPVFDTSNTSISLGPTLESQIAEAMETPMGTLAKVFSADLPGELWTIVF